MNAVVFLATGTPRVPTDQDLTRALATTITLVTDETARVCGSLPVCC